MKLANKAYVVALILLALAFSVSAQTPRSDKDPRNIAPTVGTGGTMGGPTGLFTVYDGQTLRRGEYTFSAAYSNYDRDPGNVDIADIPLSFQVGLSDHVELFFNTTAYRGIKVNATRNLSSFYLPNSKVFIGAGFTSGPAVVLAPRGPGVPLVTGAVFRPTGTQPFVPFNYVGGSIGNLGLNFPFTSGPSFGYPAGSQALLSATTSGGHGADIFPGIGSVYGSILPGIVLQTTPLLNVAGAPAGSAPAVFTLAPSYLPDAPFVNRLYGESAFNDFTFGGKWRWTGPNNPIGVGIIGYYRWFGDTAEGLGGFNQMQRGAGPGGNRGDFGASLFADARLRKWANISGNISYHYNSTVKGDIGGQNLRLLDRGDELMFAIGADFPINKWLQPIFEFRSLKYVGGRTPNAFENNPMDAVAGFRYYPARWFGFGAAYRWHANEQDKESFDNTASFSTTVLILCRPNQTACTPQTITNTFTGVPPGFQLSEDPHGYIVQAWIGRRNKRQSEVPNIPANVTGLNVSDSEVMLPCPPGRRPVEGSCNDGTSLSVATTATDAENDVLTYNYTVSGGRIVGQGANVTWDVGGLQPGSYTITAGVNDGCGVCGQTQTRTITVKECVKCEIPCACTNVNSVTGPSGVTAAGDTMTFTANTSGDVDVTYNWSVSAGTIESGQGTASITVRTTAEMAGTNVTATVELGGNAPNCSCTNNASETAGVEIERKPELVDEFGPLKDDDVKARIDNFYIRLQNDPNARGVIVNYGTPAQIKARKAQITKAINFLKKDPSRITFVDGPDKGNGIETKLWLVPSGATEPVI
jgi:hypothetical protein